MFHSQDAAWDKVRDDLKHLDSPENQKRMKEVRKTMRDYYNKKASQYKETK